jgi:acyl-CoA thioesterase-1
MVVVVSAGVAVACAGLAAACGRDASSDGNANQGVAGGGRTGASPVAARASRAEPGPAQGEAARPALVFLGDSLTAGYGLAVDEAVPALIQGEIDRAGLALRVINAGRSGDTTAGGAARVAYYLRPEVAPRALLVWLGGNDILRGLPAGVIESNLRAIIQRAHAFDRALPVFLVQMRAFPNLGADYARAFEAIFPRVAESEGATLLPFPMGDVAGRPGLNQDDGIHPTAEGSRLIARALWSSLGPHLTSPR